jgi:hypothetical protein
MTKFTETQIKVLKGNYSNIAEVVGCSRVYVVNVLQNKTGNKRGGKKADAVREKASELLGVLQPETEFIQ